MIQEKDFLYRVPVKNALVTAPGKQVRNPEILVDLEGGEFMHGNILDANSTNKLIDQSVKDAIDNSVKNDNYVTRDLLEAETSARTKSDEDLNTKIKAEQIRAEGKEKEISDKLAIVDGDSNTEGSFRKAIADVIAAAPEDLDTLKEIADKLAGIDTSDFVSKTATDIQTIESDLDLRQRLLIRRNNLFENYISILYSGITIDGMDSYIYISGSNDHTGENINESGIKVRDSAYRDMYTRLNQSSITINNKNDSEAENIFICTNFISSRKLDESRPSGFGDDLFLLNENGVRILNGDDYHVLTSNCSTIDIREYARRSELPTTATKKSLGVVKVGDGLNVTNGTISVDTTVLPAVPTNVSQLTNDSNFITAADADSRYALSATADSLSVGLSKKQDKITVNGIDVTDIETADITRLRTIVIELIDALTTSGLIRQNLNLE